MATVNLGNIKFNWKGTYNAGTAYAIDDVVSYNGSSYVCIAATTGNLPTVTAKWDVMSSAGTNGTNGTDLTTTLTTQGDLVYRDGSGLQRLAAGTSGQALLTGGAGANPSWGSVTSKLLGVHHYSNQEAYNLGNRNKSKSSPFSTSFSPVSTNSFFTVHFSSSFDNMHHVRAGLEYSTDNSSWSYMAPSGATRSGAGTSWSNDDLYKYPHLSSDYDGDDNSAVSVACAFGWTPSTPHGISTLYIRPQYWGTNSTNTLYVNRTVNNSGNDGSAGFTNITVYEFAV